MGDFGFLGMINDGRVMFSRQSTQCQHVPLRADALLRVEIVPMFAGASGDLVRSPV